MSIVRRLLSAYLMLSCAALVGQENRKRDGPPEGYGPLYQEQCAVCHGDRLQGAAQGTPLAGVELAHGDSVNEIAASIANGSPDKGMPKWSKTLSDMQIKNLALFVAESRSDLSYRNFNYSTQFEMPKGVIESQEHAFRLETVIEGLDPLPFSIEPLPDGRILLTEKKRGLSIISKDGEQSALIEGAPKTYDDTFIPNPNLKQEWGYGWMLDVAIHPDYEENGWVYIHYGDRCSDCNEISREQSTPVSLNKLVRGRIRDGQWIDEEVVWQADLKYYGSVPDIGAGGRISFDDEGHVFLSMGLGVDNHTGIQDLSTPWGKIHRVYDDGRIPLDNPFVGVEGAMESIWTYGHRSPQGLEFRRRTGELWETEMGPRGGDEVNRLIPGRNYGWPLYSKGVNYDGSEVAYGEKLGIEFDLDDIEQPVVDLTPSPAVSSFIFYTGAAFPEWENNIIVGTLKGRSLLRMELEGDKVVQRETLLQDLARFRDIEIGQSSEIYVLLEHNSGGRIVRLVRSAKRI